MSNLKKKTEYILDGVQYDSKEELEFKVFLNVLKERGLVLNEEYQPSSFQLINDKHYDRPNPSKKDLKRVKDTFLLRGIKYTCDWRVTFDPEFFKIFPKIKWIAGAPELTVCEKDFELGTYINRSFTYYFDVKGMWDPFFGGKMFPVIQKMVYDKFGVYVNKIIPKKFFTNELKCVPMSLKFTKTSKESKTYSNLGALEDALQANK